MKKEASSGEKKRSLFWIGLIVLVVMMGALGWQAKSLLEPPEPTPSPAAVRAKVPPVPPPTTIQIPQPTTAENLATQNMDEAAPQTEGDQKGKPSGQTIQEERAPESMLEQSESDPTKPMVAKAQGSDKKSPEATDPTRQDAEDKSPPSTDDPKATASAPGAKAIAEKQAVPESVPTQAAAEQAQDEVSPTDTDQTKPAPYTIQVGAFRVRKYAIEKLTQLVLKGYDPYIYKTNGDNQKPWYGVRFGHFETRGQATQALLNFKQKEKMDGIISRSDSL